MRWRALFTTLVLGISIYGSQGADTNEVEYLLNTGEQMDFNGVTDLVLLIGSTGVGKSTLAKFLLHDTSLQVLRVGSKYIFTDNGTISTVTSKSMTLLPNVYKDKETTGQVIVDCPGFSDTREPKYEIAASYFVKQVLEYAKRLKIILVENHFSLSEGRDRFGLKRLLKHVSELIPNINHFRGSLGLIANKVGNAEATDEEEKADIEAFLENFGNDVRNDLNNHRENTTFLKTTGAILTTLDVIRNDGTGSNLALFRTPNKAGSPWDSTQLNRNYQDIRDLIFQRINWVANTNQVYRYTLTTDSLVFIRDSLVPINSQNTRNEISKITASFLAVVDAKLSSDLTIAQKIQFSENMEIQFSALLNGLLASKDLSLLNENLSKIAAFHGTDPKVIQRLATKAQFYNDVGGVKINVFMNDVVKPELRKTEKKLDDAAQFYKFLQTLQTKLEIYKPQSVRQTSYRHISPADFKNFIFDSSKFHIDFENKNQILAIPLTGFLINDLNKVMDTYLNYKVNYVHNQQNKHLLIEGRNLLTSEIQARLGAYPDLETITLVAAKRIFIDHNLAVVDKNIYMLAPTFEVIGDREILLTGSNAGAYPGKAADSTVLGVPGAGGHAGYPGANSGNVLLIASDVINPNKLTIKMIGGQGGRGQNAGNGRQGVASSYPSVEFMHRGTAAEIDNYVRSLGYGVERAGDAMVVTNQKENVLPSWGGNGGVGGPGGQPGFNLIRVNKHLVASQVKVAPIVGNQGEGGDGGVGGVGLAQCARKHFRCENIEIRGKCGKWYRRKTCTKGWEYKCYPSNLDTCANYPNGGSGGKGASAIGVQGSYPVKPFCYDQLRLILNERLGVYQSIGPEFAALHTYALQNMNA